MSAAGGLSGPETDRPRKVFVTGATGFIGSVVVDQMLAAGFESIVCLTRSPEGVGRADAEGAGVRYAPGDLTSPSEYREALSGSDMVVHLAAATGSASDSELTRVNVEGTRLLLDACKSRGVRSILYVSSIAAAYHDLSTYPYGRSKVEAERLVQASGLDFTILRPTIVLGEQSPNWGVLRKMAGLPLIPLLRRGVTMVQPVDVADVARAIVAVVEGYRCPEPIVELGGPEGLSFADLMTRIRAACGLRPTGSVSIPVWMLREPLRVAGWVLGERSPFSVGQLTPFLNDGTARPNALHRHLRPSMPSLDTTLGRLCG